MNVDNNGSLLWDVERIIQSEATCLQKHVDVDTYDVMLQNI